MNIYKTKFHAKCPVNECWIEYSLTIHTGTVLKVEKILDCVHHLRSGYHEDLAEHLHKMFGGSQTLEADHHGVRIETIRPHIQMTGGAR